MADEKKRKKILDVVEKMVYSKRFHEITMEEVAKAAKIGKGTIYRFFKNKDDLFFQLATHGLVELSATVEKIAEKEKGKSFFDVFRKAAEEIDTFIEKHKALLRVLGEHEGRLHALKCGHKEVLKKHRIKMRAALSKILQLGVRSGHVRTDIPLDTQAQIFLGAINACKRFGHDVDMSVDVFIDLFLNGVILKPQLSSD